MVPFYILGIVIDIIFFHYWLQFQSLLLFNEMLVDLRVLARTSSQSVDGWTQAFILSY